MLNNYVTQNFASKQDIREVKSELEKFRVELRSELEGVRTEFKLDMKNLEHRLTLQLSAIVAGAFTLLAAWTTFLPHLH